MKWLVAIAAFAIATNFDIFLARNGVPGAGIHVGLGTAAIAAGAYAVTERRPLDLGRFTGLLTAFACLLMWSLASALFSIDVQLSLVTLARYFSIGLGMLILAALVGRSPDYDRSMALGLLAGLVVVWLSIIIDAIQPGAFSRQATRAAGLYINPNGAAQALVLIYVCLLAVWRRPRMDVWIAAAYVLVATGVFLTLSRSGIVLLGLLTISLSVVYFSAKFAVYSIILTIALAVVVLLFGDLGGVAQFQNLTTMNRLNRLFTLEAYLDQDDARLQLLRSYLSDRVGLMGSGPGVSSRLSSFGGATHNTYAKLYWESGIPAVLCYLAMLTSPLWKTRTNGTLMIVTIVSALGIFTNYNLDNRLVYLALFLALATAARQVMPSQTVGPARSKVRP